MRGDTKSAHGVIMIQLFWSEAPPPRVRPPGDSVSIQLRVKLDNITVRSLKQLEDVFIDIFNMSLRPRLIKNSHYRPLTV